MPPAVPDPGVPDTSPPNPAVPDPAVPDPAVPDPAVPDPSAEPPWRAAQERATTAAALQLVSPLLFVVVVLAGLATEIPTAASADPHGYTQIAGFAGALVLTLPALGIAGAALALVRQGRRSGAVWLVAAAALGALESLGLASGFPGGIAELAPVRIATIGVGVLWLAVCAWCVGAGVRAWRQCRAAERDERDGADGPLIADGARRRRAARMGACSQGSASGWARASPG